MAGKSWGRLELRAPERFGRRALLAVLATFAMLALPRCSSTDSSQQGGDEITRANFLIDQKQYSEAIFILDDRVKRQPTDSRARVLLASAYAGRAGIKLTSYTDFASQLSKWSEIDELLSPEDDGSVLQTVAKAAVRIQLILKAFDALPTASDPTALADLTMGLDVLDKAGALRAGPAIYRALLRVAVFKQNLHTVYRPKFLTACRISPAAMTTWFTTVVGEIEKIVTDVAGGIADPAAKARTLEFGQRLQTAIDDVASATAPQGFSLEFPEAIKKVYGKCE